MVPRYVFMDVGSSVASNDDDSTSPSPSWSQMDVGASHPARCITGALLRTSSLSGNVHLVADIPWSRISKTGSRPTDLSSSGFNDACIV